ncbi:MAG: rhodanese-related sulfurtransferase [Opitutales bacterium]
MENENTSFFEHLVLLYYKYVCIDDPEQFAKDQRALCRELGLKGRVIVAREGINGTVSGPDEAAEAYREALLQDPRFAGMPFKLSRGPANVFPKLSIKVRPEIVTLGVDLPFDPEEDSATHLPPSVWKRLAEEDPDAVVFDVRNDYESAVGRFRGAITPAMGNFRDLPEALKKYGHLRGKKILMYCTGGIRCEKASALFHREGFRDVYQLDGGIMNYEKNLGAGDDLWEGDCFVFDERVVLPMATARGKTPIGRCAHSGRPSCNYVNCVHNPCNRLFLAAKEILSDNPDYRLCPDCLASGLSAETAKNKSRSLS